MNHEYTCNCLQSSQENKFEWNPWSEIDIKLRLTNNYPTHYVLTHRLFETLKLYLKPHIAQASHSLLLTINQGYN